MRALCSTVKHCGDVSLDLEFGSQITGTAAIANLPTIPEMVHPHQ